LEDIIKQEIDQNNALGVQKGRNRMDPATRYNPPGPGTYKLPSTFDVKAKHPAHQNFECSAPRFIRVGLPPTNEINPVVGPGSYDNMRQ